MIKNIKSIFLRTQPENVHVLKILIFTIKIKRSCVDLALKS